MWICRTCERRWTGTVQAHCGACHRHFSTVGNFDRHRVGRDDDRGCVDPATLFDTQGVPRLREVVTKHGATWVANDPQGDFQARRKLRP